MIKVFACAMAETYLSITDAFSILLQKPGDGYKFENLVQPIIDQCEKYNFSILQTEPITKKIQSTLRVIVAKN